MCTFYPSCICRCAAMQIKNLTKLGSGTCMIYARKAQQSSISVGPTRQTATTWPEGVCIKYVPTSVIHSEEATRKQIRHGKLYHRVHISDNHSIILIRGRVPRLMIGDDDQDTEIQVVVLLSVRTVHKDIWLMVLHIPSMPRYEFSRLG